MPTVKEELDRARQLIVARRFAEARAVLRPLDHPKAREWLAKLDEVDPPVEFPQVAPHGAARFPVTSARSRGRVLLFTALLLTVLVIGVIALTNSGGLEAVFAPTAGPEASARQWLEGLLTGDATLAGRYTCSADINQLSEVMFNQGLFTTAAELFGGFDVETGVDMTDLSFTVVAQNTDTATVRTDGRIRVSVNGSIQETEFSEDFPMLYEDGRWKVCPSTAVVVATATETPPETSGYVLDHWLYLAEDQGDGWVEAEVRTFLINTSEQMRHVDLADYLRQVTADAYVETAEGVTYPVRVRLGADSSMWMALPSGYRMTCSGYYLYPPLLRFRYSVNAHVTRVVFPHAPELSLDLAGLTPQNTPLVDPYYYDNDDYCGTYFLDAQSTNYVGGFSSSEAIEAAAPPLESLLGQSVNTGNEHVSGVISRISTEYDEVWGNRSSAAIEIDVTYTNNNLYEESSVSRGYLRAYLVTSYGEISVAEDFPDEFTLGPGQERIVTMLLYHVLNIPLHYETYYLVLGSWLPEGVYPISGSRRLSLP